MFQISTPIYRSKCQNNYSDGLKKKLDQTSSHSQALQGWPLGFRLKVCIILNYWQTEKLNLKVKKDFMEISVLDLMIEGSGRICLLLLIHSQAAARHWNNFVNYCDINENWWLKWKKQLTQAGTVNNILFILTYMEYWIASSLYTTPDIPWLMMMFELIFSSIKPEVSLVFSTFCSQVFKFLLR